MKKTIKLLLLLFLINACTVYENDISHQFQNEIKMLNFKSDSLTINSAIKEYEKGNFTKPIYKKVFYTLKDAENTWLHFKIDSLKEDLHLILWNSYLKKGMVYLVANNKYETLHNHKRYKPLKNRKIHFRLPTWKLEKNNLKTDVFIQINDNDRHLSNFKFLLLNSNNFLKFTQIDKNYNVIISTFLIILGLIIFIFFAVQRQFNMLWYLGYITFLITDFLIFKGIWYNDLLYNYPFLFHNLKTITQALIVLFGALFFLQFYPFPKKKSIAKSLLKIAIFSTLGVLIMLFIKFIFNDMQFNLYWFWIPIRIAAILIVIAHFILIFQKVIPLYLGLAFFLSMLFGLIHLSINPTPIISIQKAFFIENFSYLTAVLETVLITYYILSKIIKERILAIKLKQENLKLRTNFQNNLLKNQHNERNELVSNVHDTFGGYLEALKLRLLQKNDNTPEKVQEILDAFYKDYRYLLNSLYAPKVNSENFIENLIEFCEKLNQLSNSTINHNFSIINSQLSQEKCLHLYRIISELVTNAIKHSKASEIKINIKQDSVNEIILEVNDNGIGFNTNSITKKGFGLNNIKQRVEQIKAKININSNNLGTNILITIPKNE
ncbi:sensor histidine kinase [Polaribacter ponticola]|uniref:histidine kinase n=1 Tax=Polaribacter ponticola TaxID=2978475 RepID=A0ABT5S735_9FLAO|nr:ATP-binding protein [Polaribacter sp. MSW5]MDD7913914.1 ATP-binding protein [Polaribacter sp. MSW5]